MIISGGDAYDLGIGTSRVGSGKGTVISPPGLWRGAHARPARSRPDRTLVETVGASFSLHWEFDGRELVVSDLDFIHIDVHARRYHVDVWPALRLRSSPSCDTRRPMSHTRQPHVHPDPFGH